MSNLNNAIDRVSKFKGKLSKSVICSTAKQTLNQYSRGWLKPDSELAELVSQCGMLELLEAPLLDRKLDEALTTQGLEFLKRYLFKANGARRNTADLKYVSDTVFEMVKTFKHFSFAGFETDGYGDYFPMWRVHSKLGTFVYSYTGGRFSGKSGGFEVHSLNRKVSS